MNQRPQFDNRIQGNCPMGCGETLFIGSGGYITCSYIPCPRPDAVATILAERETEHIVNFGRTTFSLLHPLRERLDGELLDCALGRHITDLAGPPVCPGRYRAQLVDDRWTWEEVEQR